MIYIQRFTFNPFQENTYLLYNEEGEAFIIDPGCSNTKEEKELENFIHTKNLKPTRLIQTHCHLDHILGNHFVHKTYNLTPEAHAHEKQVLDMAPRASELWGVPYLESPEISHFLDEKSEIKLGNDVLKAIFAPGHSPGSLCFYSESQGFIIAGDVLFYGSIGRTDLPGGNHEQLLKSIRNGLFVLPDSVKVYPGHGPETSIGFEKLNNPFLK